MGCPALASPTLRLSFRPAEPGDTAALAALRTAAADALTRAYGKGHWSSGCTERGVQAQLRGGDVYAARSGGALVGTWQLCTQKPWAIDVTYFRKVTRPLYLLNMAVDPPRQRQGAGRQCVLRAIESARQWPADSIRLDAYDSPAGAGEFYRKCGFIEVGRVSYRSVPLVYFEFLL